LSDFTIGFPKEMWRSRFLPFIHSK
jgi:hypothetical protein